MPDKDIRIISAKLAKAKRPVILAGNGVKQSKLHDALIMLAEKIDAPVVTSLSAFDLLPYGHRLNYGFIGTNGHRYANFIADKADLVLVLGNRLSVRSLGVRRELFAPHAELIRVDADSEQLNCKVRDDEFDVIADVRDFLPLLIAECAKCEHKDWLNVCAGIKDALKDKDIYFPHKIIARLSEIIPAEFGVCADIGQNFVWLAQSFRVKPGQQVCMSHNHGPMGYSIPAAIGVYHACGKPVAAFCGDGGFMMNVQELQFMKREHIPNKIIVLNNKVLGMIRAWQERYLDNYAQTTQDSGYEAPDFRKIAEAFGLKYTLIESISDLDDFRFEDGTAELIEVIIPSEIDTCPNGSMHDQKPQIDRELFNMIVGM